MFLLIRFKNHLHKESKPMVPIMLLVERHDEVSSSQNNRFEDSNNVDGLLKSRPGDLMRYWKNHTFQFFLRRFLEKWN